MTDKKETDSGNLENDLDKLDQLLTRGMNDLSDIEIHEITMGLTEEEISEQFSNDGLSKIERSEFSTARNVGNIKIEDSIQFIVDNKHEMIKQIPLEEIELLKEVRPDDKIATISLPEKNTQPYVEVLSSYSDAFQEEAGVRIVEMDDVLAIHAAREGKIVIFHDRVHVVSADADGKCIVRIAPDKMSVTVDLVVHRGKGKKITLLQALDELDKNNVVKGVNRTLLEESISRANKERCDIKAIKIAEGKIPEDGDDAKITFYCDTETPDIGFRIRPDGKIDYKKQAPIKMAKEGELLAKVSEPGKGIPGYTVCGEEIPARDGEDNIPVEGQNVRAGTDGSTFYAGCSGMVSFHDGILEVFPLYQVDGDVDMHCGNIDFNGSVTILGTVQTGFEVKADGDIFITGSVEAAQIIAGRDIRVNGAILGGADSLVKAGRNVFAGHVQNGFIEAQGDVVVVRSIMHSTVYSTGKIYLHDRNGSIIGGMVSSLQGIESMSIGSAMGTSTEVVAGSDYLIQRKRKEIGKIIQFVTNNITKIDTVLKPLMEIVKKGIPLGIDKKRRLKSIIDKRKQLSRQLHVLRHKYEMLKVLPPPTESIAVIVQNTLHTDVTIKILNATLKTNEAVKGVQCVLNKKKNQIELNGLNIISF